LILWIGANYSYGQALSHISAAEVTTVFSSNLAFVYLLSWIILRDAFLVIGALAVLLAIAGIVLMVQAAGIGGMTFIGVTCAIVSALVAAVYKVLFKKVVGNANFGQVSLFMSLLGICNLLLNWPIVLALILSGVETAAWDALPWGFMCGSAVLGLCVLLETASGQSYLAHKGDKFGTEKGGQTVVVDAKHMSSAWKPAGSSVQVQGVKVSDFPGVMGPGYNLFSGDHCQTASAKAMDFAKKHQK